jgi:hypothetical protein
MKKNAKNLNALPRLKPLPLLLLALWAPVCDAAEETTPEPAVEEPGVVARPRPEGVPALQMSTDYAYPALGFGTYAPISQVEARGFRVEPFTVLAGIQAGIGYDDNVALSSTSKVGSLFTTVAPSVAVGLDGATQRYYFVYRGNYGVYASNAQSDYTDHNIALTAANAWTTRFRTLAAYEFVRGHTPRGIAISSTAQAERWTQQTLHGTANYGAVGAQGGVQGDVGHISRRYMGSTTASAIGEYDRVDLAGTFYYRVAPKTRAFVRAAWAEIEHPGDASLDSKEAQFQAGATWEALATTTGRAGFGYTTKDFAASSRPNFSGYSFDLGAMWTPRLQTSFDVAARRFLSETLEAGSAFLVNSVGSFSWNQLWLRGIRSTVNYAYGRIEHQGIVRTDSYQSFAARVSYGLSRSLRLGAELRHDSRTSDLVGADYSRNIFLLTAETAL